MREYARFRFVFALGRNFAAHSEAAVKESAADHRAFRSSYALIFLHGRHLLYFRGCIHREKTRDKVTH